MPDKIKQTAKKVKEAVQKSEEAPKKRQNNTPARKERVVKRRIAKVKSLKNAAAPNTVTDNRLELLITTVSRNKAEYYIDLLQSFDINMQFVALGHGTADAKMLAAFGFTDSDKTVIFSIIQGNKIKDALATLEEKFRTIKNGKGIAYTVPLSSVIGTLIFGFLSNNTDAVKDNKENKK